MKKIVLATAFLFLAACGFEPLYVQKTGDNSRWYFDGDFDNLPEDWTCPVCGVGKEQFEKVEE